MLVSTASAHVTLVYPTGGETFAPGTEVEIAWHLDISHGDQDWDLYFSSDGGVTWEAIQLNIPVAILSYQWTVPDIETSQGKIKVVQDNAGLDYEDRCGSFSIQSVATSISNSGPLPESPVLFVSYPNPFTTSSVIEFVTRKPGEVLLEVFDMQGVKVATVVSATLPAGRHQANWRPSGLAAGSYLYRFAMDGQQRVRKTVLTY